MDNIGNPISNSTITVRSIIRSGNTFATSSPLYTETRSATTDVAGLFDFKIGSPVAISTIGALSAVNWNDNKNYYLQTYMDPLGGSSFVEMGHQQLSSVPFALSSVTADSLLLPYTGNDNTINSFTISNNFNGAGVAIRGVSYENNTNAVGILGEVPFSNTSGTGVRGRSFAANSIGVEGLSINGIALKGRATGSTATGVLAENTNLNGKALDVNGNIRIAGGNTNPGSGKVLTSDASGNATWIAPQKIFFKAVTNTNINIAHNSTIAISNFSEHFDIGNCFTPHGGGVNANSFVAPIDGYYQFSVACNMGNTSLLYNFNYMTVKFEKNGVEYTTSHTNFSGGEYAGVQASESFYLNAGDKIKVKVLQSSGGSTTAYTYQVIFEGHLLGE